MLNKIYFLQSFSHFILPFAKFRTDPLLDKPCQIIKIENNKLSFWDLGFLKNNNFLNSLDLVLV